MLTHALNFIIYLIKALVRQKSPILSGLLCILRAFEEIQKAEMKKLINLQKSPPPRNLQSFKNKMIVQTVRFLTELTFVKVLVTI